MVVSDRHETLRNEVEKIVRSEGDMTLNIDKFIAKMMSEMEACITPGPYGLDLAAERVSRFNGIPEKIILELWKLHKEKESSFGNER